MLLHENNQTNLTENFFEFGELVVCDAVWIACTFLVKRGHVLGELERR